MLRVKGHGARSQEQRWTERQGIINNLPSAVELAEVGLCEEVAGAVELPALLLPVELALERGLGRKRACVCVCVGGFRRRGRAWGPGGEGERLSGQRASGPGVGS